MLRLTVLGCHGPYPPAGGGTSCYLVQSETTSIAVDFGSGALCRLQQVIDLSQIDAILLTHLHADHACEIPLLDYYAALNRLRFERKIPLYLPKEELPQCQVIEQCNSFEIADLGRTEEFRVGDIAVSPFLMAHPMTDYALRFACGTSCFTYSGDTRANDRIAASLEGATHYLCDAAGVRRSYREGGPHISLTELAHIAEDRKVRLLLTHFNGDPAEALAEVQETYSNAECVREGAVYLL